MLHSPFLSRFKVNSSRSFQSEKSPTKNIRVAFGAHSLSVQPASVLWSPKCKKPIANSAGVLPPKTVFSFEEIYFSRA